MSLQIRKSKDRVASRPYTEFLSTHCTCVLCGRAPCDPAHTISRKWADGSDLTCAALCRACHDLFDAKGKKKMEWLESQLYDRHNITVEILIERLQVNFRYLYRLPLEGAFEDVMRSAGLLNAPYTKRKNRHADTK